MIRLEKHVLCYLAAKIWKDGDWYTAECVGLPVVSQGETDGEAIASLIEAVQLFITSCVERGTLEQVLLKHNWKPALSFPRRIERGTFALPVPLPQVVQRQLEGCRT